MSEPNTHPARASDTGYRIRPRADIMSTSAKQRDDEPFPDDFFDHRRRCYQTAWAVVGLLIGLGSIHVNTQDEGSSNPPPWANEMMVNVSYVAELLAELTA